MNSVITCWHAFSGETLASLLVTGPLLNARSLFVGVHSRFFLVSGGTVYRGG